MKTIVTRIEMEFDPRACDPREDEDSASSYRVVVYQEDEKVVNLHVTDIVHGMSFLCLQKDDFRCFIENCQLILKGMED
jgi:hypothetical protein